MACAGLIALASLIPGSALRRQGRDQPRFADAGVPTTLLQTSFYWENFISFGMGPRRGEDGKLVLTLPMNDKKLPSMAAEDIGKCAYGIFKRGEELIGNTVSVAGDHVTGERMASAFSRALGEDVSYFAVPHDIYRGFGFPGADDLGNMFQFKCMFEDYYCGVRDLAGSRSLNPDLLTFDAWLDKNAGSISIG